MEIGDIKKVASRKRINVDAEKLREKVSRETTKIIKLKVAQDTAYWDLKEKLQQLESNHERLQQNMVEVQMQHEALSGQYQDELRLRPETLNKLNSTRAICDVLEDYSERLKETLSRCKTDQATLCEAYQKSGQFVKEIKTKQNQLDEKHRGVVSNLEEKLKLTSEHQHQLVNFFNTAKQQADNEIQELKTRLNTAQSQKDELLKIANDMARDLDVKKHDLETRDKTVVSLQNDLKRLMQEYSNQCNEMKNTIHKLEKEVTNANESNETIKKALSNQEEFTNTVCDENKQLQEKISLIEEEGIKLKQDIVGLKDKLKEMTKVIGSLNIEVENLLIEKKRLETELSEKDSILTNSETENAALKIEITDLEKDKMVIVEELTKTDLDRKEKAVAIEQLEIRVKDFETKVNELAGDLQDCRITSDEKIKDLTLQLETKQAESTSKGETIAKLMNDIQMGTEVRSRLETNLDKTKKEMEIEREKAWEKEKKLIKQNEHLDIVVRNKEEELTKQMSIILDMRNEKEKLQEKISCMQSTIDNIQKELNGRLTKRDPGERPEMDDNAVMSPAKKKVQPLSKRIPEFAVPRSEPKNVDSMLFNIFSDSSMDGDAIDSTEVNRRFEAMARGEQLAPMPLSALKRRRPHHMMQGNKQNQISLSQVRDEIKTKEKTFFRNKRPGESKMKRMKKIEERVDV